jgi:hypothetical protein
MSAQLDLDDVVVGSKSELAINELAQLRNRIKELEAEREWQPIETYPRNNNDVLLVISGEVTIGSHALSIRQWEADGCYYHDISYDHVTHWMHLPEPPKETI